METTAETKTILIVDDDEDFRSEIEAALVADGFRVTTAEGQRQASASIEEELPDLAVINLVMEELDSGFVLAYHIKKAHANTPVILITASAGDTHLDFDTSTASERSWIKADVLLNKPLRYEQLKREINRLLQTAEAHV